MDYVGAIILIGGISALLGFIGACTYGFLRDTDTRDR